MRTLFIYGLTVLCSCLLLAEASADEEGKEKPKAATDSGTQVKKPGDAENRPLTAAEKARLAEKEAAAEEALRQKVAENIESIVDGLGATRTQKAKVKSLTSESQWKAAVSAFRT